MSAEATSWAWSHAEQMESPSQLLVLLALAEHASPTGDCFPNRKTIARMCGYDPKSGKGTVTKHMNKIEERLGLIERTARYEADRSGRQTSNIYRLKLEVKGATPSGAVATPPVAEQGTPPSAGQQPQEPGTTEPKSEPPPSVSADVQKVYDHHLAVFKPKTPPKLGPSLVRQIEKALKEYAADALCQAIDGLFEWRRQKNGKTTLGAIFDTYPGGKPLTEQIAFFISQSKGATRVGGKFPSGDRAIVAEKQRLVQRGHRLSTSEEAVQQAKDAELWLREHGIETVVNPVGVPTFRPRRDGNEGGA